MHGRADVLASLGRRAEAAETLDRLALILERDGRLADACDVARRALELAESRGRRQHVESLVARLRTAAPEDAAAADALERALGVLESGPGVAPRASRTTADGQDAEAGDGPSRRAATARSEPADPRGRGITRGRATSMRPAGARSSRPSGTAKSGSSTPRWTPATRPSPSSRRTPTSTSLLAELYLDRGWRGPAAEKLVLLGRLAQLTGDGATRARLCYLAAARFPDDPRLAAVCA